MKRVILILLMMVCMAFTAEAHDYTDIFANATEDDYTMLERVVYNEAACVVSPDCFGTYEQLFPCCVAVVETVCNRVLADEWKNTIAGVCTQKGQFVCRKYRSNNSLQDQLVSDAINYVVENGRTQLPSNGFTYFATKRQSYAKNHVWIGGTKSDGSPWKTRGMWFGESKN